MLLQSSHKHMVFYKLTKKESEKQMKRVLVKRLG